MTTTRAIILLLSISLLGACSEPVSHTVTTESEIFTMQERYASMFGPSHEDYFSLTPSKKPEVLWVTAIKANIVGSDGQAPGSPEYFCHSVLARDETQPAVRQKMLGPRFGMARKMFTLVQGLTEVRFPEGFGMPVLSNDDFISHVMVMNPSEKAEPVQVGVDSNIEYVRESERTKKMKPLFLVSLVTKVPIEAEDIDHTEHQHGGDQTCLSTDADTQVARSVDRTGHTKRSPVTTNDAGAQETGHWYVPPGRHSYRHRLDEIGKLVRFDTRAHYIYAHLHPYGESLELNDLTTGESVFKADANNYADQVAIEKITHYSSEVGLPIYSDHDYEIVATYNNTTDHDIDSMAVIYLYLRDSLEQITGGRRYN